MGQLGKLLLVGVGTVLAAWIAWGVYATRSAESIPFERRQRLGDVELRRYPQTVVVETTAPDQRTAFRRLFRYISGANEGGEEIAMTAPVETSDEATADADGATDGEEIAMTAPVRTRTETEGDELQMAFYLPAEYTSETAPDPTESSVTLRTEPAKTVAVRRFSWFAPDWRVSRQTQKLRATLDTEGFEPTGSPSLLRYNDPWTPPFMRRNEVAVDVAST